MFLPTALSLTALLLTAGAPAHAQTPQAPTPSMHALGFWNAETWVPLEADGSSIGVRFEQTLDVFAIRSILHETPGLQEKQAGTALIHLGHTVILQTTPGTSVPEAWRICAGLTASEGVLSASPRLWAPHRDPYYLTEEILIRWAPSTTKEQRLTWTDGLLHTADLGYAENPGEVYRVPAGEDILAVSNALAESGLVEFAIPDFQLQRVSYAGTDDPLYGDQWHLESTGQNGAGVDQDIDVEGAWDITRGTSTITVATVDTGVELGHPDLVENLVTGTDVLSNDDIPQAEDGSFLFFIWEESHGTAVSGVIAGRGDNALGVSGVAPRCTVMPIRFLSELFGPTPTVQDEADAHNFACNNGAAVINNSWGPLFGAVLPASTKAAIDNCNQFGRDGLGSIVFFAAGNSGNDNSNNGYAAYDGVLGVTACTDQGVKAGYSSFGSTVDCTAPSNGGVNGITTTDRIGSKGYSNSDYADDFGGTSSASPTAAGVMALILSAHPGLTRDEAIEVMLTTTDIIDPIGGNYDASGHSDWYGQGRVNAAAAVTEAAARADLLAGASNTIYLNGTTRTIPGVQADFDFSLAPASTAYFAVVTAGNP
ncbi:MAG: S8 family serine peptidase, partial [Planctomycetota bacterium]